MTDRFIQFNGLPLLFVDPNDPGHDAARDVPEGYWLPAVGIQFTYDGDILTTGARTTVESVEFNRPGNTTPYTALDAVNSANASYFTFANMARLSGGTGRIVKARMMTDQSTNTSSYRLHLFHTAPTPIADNSLYTLLWANRANRIGRIDIGPLGTEGAGSNAAYGHNITDWLEFECASGDKNIYALLETLVAHTPASAQGYYLELTAQQD